MKLLFQGLIQRYVRVQLALVLGVGLASSPLCLAQLTSGDLVGTVRDSTAATVPGALVQAAEESTRVKATQTAGASGQYRFTNLHIGRYDLTVTAPGFTKWEVKGVNIELSKTSTQNVELSLGQVSTSVDVSDAAQTIDTTTAQIQTNFSQKLTSDLPIAGNSNGGVVNLSLLSAGVANAGGVGTGTHRIFRTCTQSVLLRRWTAGRGSPLQPSQMFPSIRAAVTGFSGT